MLIIAITIIVLVILSIGAIIIYNQSTTTRFSFYLSTTQTEVIQGSSSQIQATVTIFGKAENVILSSFCNSSGINCTFEPSSGKSNFTSVLTFAVSDSTPTGKYNVTLTASGGGQVINRTNVLSVLSGNVTMSGTVGVINPYYNIFHLNYQLINIQFIDVETSNLASFSFASLPNAASGNGNYSVILLNKHAYHITVNFKSGGDDYGDYTVYAPAGETTISKNFP